MILYAFKYCLNKFNKPYNTREIKECSEFLINNWEMLYTGIRKQIQKDIYKAIEGHTLVSETNKRLWSKVLKLEILP